MGRKRTGWTRVRNGVLSIGFTLRSGRSYEQKVPPRADGRSVDRAYAKKVLSQLLAQYDARLWDPEQAAPERPTVHTVIDHLRDWIKTQTYESAPKDALLIERYLASSPLKSLTFAEIRPRHGLELAEFLSRFPSARGGVLAPRSVRNIFDVARRGLDDAVLRDKIENNPFNPVRGRLPSIADKDPTAREGWTFTPDEIAMLIADPRVPPERRVLHAILFFTGCRPNEMAAMRLRDWDRARAPLERITITRAIKSVSRREGGSKTGAKKLVPVHPVLRDLLAQWTATGWKAYQGREPKTDDHQIPNQDGAPQNSTRTNRNFQRDLERLGLRKRHQDFTQHTFVSQAQDDGADGAIRQRVTHAPPKRAQRIHTRVLVAPVRRGREAPGRRLNSE